MDLAEARYESLFVFKNWLSENKMPCFNGCETYEVSEKFIHMGKKLVVGLHITLNTHKT
jgi:hypothetical protein